MGQSDYLAMDEALRVPLVFEVFDCVGGRDCWMYCEPRWTWVVGGR